MIALLGLWEFGDIAALLVPGFGRIPAYLWNHIIVGLMLIIVGVWSARTKDARTAKTMYWIAVGAGVWLIIGSLIFRYPAISVGLWNDIIVGILVAILGVWAALSSPQVRG